MNNDDVNKIPHLRFIIHQYGSESEGEFDWGAERIDLFDKFYVADEIPNPQIAQQELKQIIYTDPEFIDAYGSLGLWEIKFENYGNAKRHFNTGVSIGQALIPKTFNGQIIWGNLDNRPYLETLYGLGVCYQLTNENEKAFRTFNKILKYNPGDNQGARFLLPSFQTLGVALTS